MAEAPEKESDRDTSKPSLISVEGWMLSSIPATGVLSASGSELDSQITLSDCRSLRATGVSSSTSLSPAEFTQVKAKKKEDIKRAFRAMKEAQKVDLCFLMDATGSMGRWLRDVTDCISDWSEQLHKNYEHMSLQLAMVCYTDYDQPEDTRTKKLEFTSHMTEFQDFIRGINTEAGIGGDCAEDVFGGLDAAIHLKWRRGGTKVLIHFADAPCHGAKYHDQSVSDTHMEGDPAKIDETRLMFEVKKLGIEYWFGYINKKSTDQMIQVFNDTLREMSDDKMMIEQFDARDRDMLVDAVYSSLANSIASTVTRLQGKGMESLRRFSIDKAIPDFATLEEHEATITITTSDSTSMVVSAKTASPTTFDLSHLQGDKIRFKRGRAPFAQGKERLAYHAVSVPTNHPLVLKEFKRTGRSSSHYQEVIDAHARASMFATQFNTEKPDGIPNLDFVQLSLFQLGVDVDGRTRYFTCEPFIEGKYQKFNSNGNFAAKSPSYHAIQAFSHFSWSRSGGRMVICDIQGVKTDDGFVLTDPAIHHVDYRRNYGNTNLGRKGIKGFFRIHECNDICKRMKLKPFSEATAN